jgi:hypothetical protein
MRIKKHFLASLIVTLILPTVVIAAPAGSFDSMFGMTCGDLNCWIQGTWSWIAGLLITVSTIMLMVAGYIYMVSGGDPQRVTKAKQIIVGVFSGLFILLVSYFFFTQILGVPVSVWTF